MLTLKAWTIIVLEDPAREKVLLLKRASNKKIFPNLITGIGGSVEIDEGECEDIAASNLRELEEETVLKREDIRDFSARLITSVTEHEGTRILYWFTATLKTELSDLACPEGVLDWYKKTDLPIDAMTPTAKQAIPFILSLHKEDNQIYDGVFKVFPDGEMELIVAK